MPNSVTPTTQSISWNRIGTLPSLFQLDVEIEPLLGITSAQFSIVFENTSVIWLDTPGASPSDLTFVGNSATIPLELQNIDDLLSGFYKATIVVNMYNAGGLAITKTSVVNFTLTGNAAGAIITDQPNYDVLYNRATNTLSGETLVSILNNTVPDNLTFETIGSLFKEKTFTTSFTLEEDPAFPFSTNTELPTSGTKTVSCKLIKAGIFLYGFTITMTIINDGELITTPAAFNFELRKGYNETKTDTLKINNPLAKSFTITKPSWLNLSATSGSASADITVTTNNSDALSVGVLTGNIVIAYDAKTITIPVTQTVTAFLDMPTETYNFCLDKVFLQVTRQNDAARFVRIKMEMNFATAEGSFPVISNYTLPYFQNQVKTDIGEKIQNYFPVSQNHLFETLQTAFDNIMIYKAASVKLTVEELDINYTILLSKIIEDLDFFAGNRPSEFPIFTNFPLRRRYSGSQFIFSYVSDLVSPADLAPGEVGNITNAKEVHAVMMTDDEILNYSSLQTNLGIDIIPFPDQNRQNMLQWLNNNLVPEWFIFSGKYRVTDDFEHIYDDFQVNGQKYDTRESQRLTIETGFILKEESKLIKEMIKSKLSFIKLEGEIYRCFPIPSKLVELEAEQNLINYELEFLIVK